MENKPSFMTSTFSILTIISVLSFCGLCVYLKDVVNLKEVSLMLLSAYGVKKGMELSNENGKKPPEPSNGGAS